MMHMFCFLCGWLLGSSWPGHLQWTVSRLCHLRLAQQLLNGAKRKAKKERVGEGERHIEGSGGTISSGSLGKCATSAGTFCHTEHCELHEMA